MVEPVQTRHQLQPFARLPAAFEKAPPALPLVTTCQHASPEASLSWEAITKGMSRGPTNGLSSTARRLSPTARLLMGAAATLVLFQASRSGARRICTKTLRKHLIAASQPASHRSHRRLLTGWLAPCSCSCFLDSMGGPQHPQYSWRSTPP